MTKMTLSQVSMVDINNPEHGVEVEFDKQRRVLYVHVDGMTVLRIQAIDVHVDVTVDGQPVNPRPEV